MAGSSEEQDVPRRRTPRRRTAVSRVEREAREPRVSRRVGSRRLPAKEEIIEEPVPKKEPEETIENRKAPTPLLADKLLSIRKKKRTIISIVLMLIGIGSSAAVGYTDQGRIDVQQIIEERNERIRNNRPDERDLITSTVEVPVQDTDTIGKADGGLIPVGTGDVPTEPVVVDTASSTASSTELVASSTDVVASSTEEVVEAVAEEQPTTEAEEVVTQETTP